METSSSLRKAKRLVNSTLVFLAAYMLCVLYYQFALAFLCTRFGYSPTVTFNKLEHLPTSYNSWSSVSVVLVFSGAVFSLLLLSFVSFHFYGKLSRPVSLLHYFLFWMFVLPFNFFLTFVATCVAGEINYNWGLYQGLANIVSWFRIPIFITIPIILGAIAASVIFGYSFGKTTLRFIYSSKLGRDRSGRREFLLFSYFLPSWLGLCLLLPILSAYSVVLHIAFITNLFFIGVGMLFRSDNLRMGVKADKRDVLNHLSPAFYIGLPVIYALIIFFL